MNNQLSTQNKSLTINQPSPVDRAAMQNLMPVEKRMMEAALQPKINTQPPLDVVTVFISLITTAYTRAGYKMPDEATLAIYADEFYTSLLEREQTPGFARLTIPEVREALKEGVYGEYGEFTGLNPKTFMQFCKGYITSDARKEALKHFESKKAYLLAQRELTPDEREVYNKDFVNILYADYLQGKLVCDYIPSFIYDVLESFGKIQLTSPQKLKVQERAKAYFARLRTSKKYKGNARSIGDELAAYIQDRDQEAAIKNVCKQFSVFDYFEELAKASIKTVFPTTKLLK